MKNLLIFLFVLLTINATSQQRYAYKVVIEYHKTNRVKCNYVQDLKTVSRMLKTNIGIHIPHTQLLRGGNLFFTHENNTICFYCEKKRVIKKRNGSNKYRKVKRDKHKQLILK